MIFFLIHVFFSSTLNYSVEYSFFCSALFFVFCFLAGPGPGEFGKNRRLVAITPVTNSPEGNFDANAPPWTDTVGNSARGQGAGGDYTGEVRVQQQQHGHGLTSSDDDAGLRREWLLSCSSLYRTTPVVLVFFSV